MKTYDVIIIGAGPGGFTAGIYAKRQNLKVLVLGKMLGGTASWAHKIGNFPGFEEITGVELMKKIINQSKKLGIEIKQEEVIDVKKEDNFIVKTNKKEYLGKNIILATGTQRAKLGLENEGKFVGKGISYCATCDAMFYKDKIVGVVGGGNAALTAALLLSKFAKKVYLIYRRNKFFRAEKEWIENVEENEKIKCLFDSNITKFIGKDNLEKLEINEKEEIEVDGLFIEIGGISNLELANKLGLKLDNDFIKVDKTQRTNVEGVFAVGDVTNSPLKQIITACGEGAVAGYEVYKKVSKEKNNE